MKTREEYLVEFEAKLLGILKDMYKSVDNNLILTFTLSMLVALIHWGSVTDISFLGATIALNRVDMLILMPIVIALIYILIDHKLLRIAEVYRQINKTAEKLLFLNQEAKPVTIREIHLYGAGVTGLILSLSRWQVKRLLINNPFKFEFRPKHPTKQKKRDCPRIY